MIIRIIPLLLCVSFILSACGNHREAPQLQVAKPAVKKQFNINSMQPGFLFLAAQDAIEDGQRALATQLLTALVQKEPKAIHPRFQLLELLIDSEQYDQANQIITALSQHQSLSDQQREHLELATIRLHIFQQQSDTALLKLESFLKTHLAHLAARNMQIKLLSSQGRNDEALVAIDNAIKAEDLAEFRLLQAQLLIKLKRFSAAKIALIQMQKLSPHLDTPVLILSSIAVKENKIDDAESMLQNFLKQYPEASRISQALAQLLVKEKRSVEAILVYRDAVTHSGNNPDILRALGMLYFRHQNYTEAETVFRQLVDLKADDISLFHLAASLEALERIPEASLIYQKIDPAASLASEAQLRLAAINVMNDDIPQAVKRLKGILSNNAMHLDALMMLSTIRLSQNKLEQLIEETDAVLAIPKLPPQLLFNRAVAFETLQQYEQVEVMLSRLIQTTPSHAEAMNFLGYTYAVQGIKLGKAEALIHRALLLKPDNGYYLDSLAWVYYKNGDFSKAIDTQLKALEQIPEDSVMREHYGDMLWQHGDKEAARQAWQKAIELNSAHKRFLRNKIANGLTPSQ